MTINLNTLTIDNGTEKKVYPDWQTFFKDAAAYIFASGVVKEPTLEEVLQVVG